VPLPGLWHVTWPLFVSLGLSLSLNFTDAFFLSRISDSAAAAAGAINPLLGATLVLFSVIGQAGASVAGRLHGARRHDELPLTYLVLLGFNLVAGLTVSGLLFALHPWAPGWLGLRGEAAEAAQTYMAVLGDCQVLKAVQLAYGNMLNSRGATRWVMVEAIATNVANIGLNFALYKGYFGVKATVGLVSGATMLALLFGMLFTIAVVHWQLGVRFPVRSSWPKLRAALKPILRIGLPSATEPVSYQVAQVVINLLVISLGARALATRTYVLDKVVPVTTTKEVAGTGGAVSVTSTSYILVPGEKVTLQQYVGHKVEVTGMMVPAGDSKTKTKIERDNAPDTKITTKVDNDKPHFQVMSVKQLAEPCM